MYVWSGILYRNIWYATMQKINVGFRLQSRRCYNVKTRRCYNVKKRCCYNVGLWRLKNFHFQPISNVYLTSVSDVVSTSIQRQLLAGMYADWYLYIQLNLGSAVTWEITISLYSCLTSTHADVRKDMKSKLWWLEHDCVVLY